MELLLNKKHELRGNGYFLGRCKENICECLTITIEDELLHTKWPYLEFKVNNGDKFSTERLVITDGVLKYDIPNGLLEDGKVKIQVVFRDETGFVWKSFVREFAVGESLCVADDLPIQYPDFITEAQVILDEYEELYDEILDGKVMSTNDFTDADKEKLDGLTNYDDTELTEKMNLRNVFEIYTTRARFKEETLGRKYNGGEQVIVLKDENYNDATIVYEYYGDPFNHFSYLGKVNINLDLDGQTLSLGTKNGILILRDNKGNWKSSIQHSVPSDSQAEECVLFLNSNSQISWMFASKYKKDGVIYPIDPTKNIDWDEANLIPDIHIRNGKVFIGEKVDETSDYGLHYDGIVNFKELHIDKVKSLPYTQAEKEKLDELKIVPEAIGNENGSCKIYFEKTGNEFEKEYAYKAKCRNYSPSRGEYEFTIASGEELFKLEENVSELQKQLETSQKVNVPLYFGETFQTIYNEKELKLVFNTSANIDPTLKGGFMITDGILTYTFIVNKYDSLTLIAPDDMVTVATHNEDEGTTDWNLETYSINVTGNWKVITFDEWGETGFNELGDNVLQDYIKAELTIEEALDKLARK